jgi:hypothetical protein
MHSRSKFLVLLTGALATGLVWSLARPSAAPGAAAITAKTAAGSSPAIDADQLRAELRAELRSELRAELRAEMAAGLDGLHQAVGELDGATGEGAQTRPTEAPHSPAEALALDQARFDAHAAALSEALMTEQVDHVWRAEIDQQVGNALAGPSFAGAELRETECGATLCRVDLAYDSLDARQRAEEAIPLHRPFATQGIIHAESPDSLEVSVYFARKGHRLPRLDETLLP